MCEEWGRMATGFRPVRPWQVLRGKIKKWARPEIKKRLPHKPSVYGAHIVVEKVKGEWTLYQLLSRANAKLLELLIPCIWVIAVWRQGRRGGTFWEKVFLWQIPCLLKWISISFEVPAHQRHVKFLSLSVECLQPSALWNPNAPVWLCWRTINRCFPGAGPAAGGLSSSHVTSNPLTSLTHADDPFRFCLSWHSSSRHLLTAASSL